MVMILSATCDDCGNTQEWTAAARENVDVDGNPADEGWICDPDGDLCPGCSTTMRRQ